MDASSTQSDAESLSFVYGAAARVCERGAVDGGWQGALALWKLVQKGGGDVITYGEWNGLRESGRRAGSQGETRGSESSV